MQEYKLPKWTFIYEHCGDTTLKTFNAETWPEGLENFLIFAKGCGFMISDKQVDKIMKSLEGDFI